MTQIFLQPAIGMPAPVNVEKSIKNAIDLKSLTLGAGERPELESLFPNASAKVWGVPEEVFWKKMQRGDVVLFLTGPNGLVRYAGIVAATIQSEKVAAQIWGNDFSHFKHIYFLTQVREVNLKRSDINASLGYDEGYNWQRFSLVANASGVQAFLSTLPAFEQIPAYVDEAVTLDESLGEDAFRPAAYRKEQAKLKDAIFAGRLSMHCAVCSGYFPRKFLVASHLKRRSECTSKERIDSNVVLPMCTFGCDALYEHGYLSLDWKSGKVIETAKTEDLEGTTPGAYLQNVIGKPSSYPLVDSRPYLQWHHGKYGAPASPVSSLSA